MAEHEVKKDGAGEMLLTVTWGKEVLQPLQYHSIEIGPFQITRKIRKEDASKAVLDWYDEMEKWAEDVFQKKVERFKNHVKRLNGMMKSN